MKPTSTTVAHPIAWSAPVSEIEVGHSVKFHICWRGSVVEAFVINFRGHYYAYINYCVHAGTPLDWWPNEFFDPERRFLTCGTHGSLYDPDTGKCAGGPCAGRSLFPLSVRVSDGRVIVTPGALA